MGEYIDKCAGILDRLKSMSAKIPDELAVILFLHSMGAAYTDTLRVIEVRLFPHPLSQRKRAPSALSRDTALIDAGGT
jgi:hypothetical protein